MSKSKYFKLEDLLSSETAVNHGIENHPSWADISNLYELATCVLDPIREVWGEAIIVESGFRCVELNALVGGVPTSDHQDGLAADIRPSSVSKRTVVDLFNTIRTMVDEGIIDVDQIILYRRKKIVHVGIGKPYRRQFIVK